MRIYIFEDVGKLTGNYHSGGGLVIIARDLDHAKEVIAEDEYIEPTEKEWLSAIEYELKFSSEKPGYYIFPDAGCC